MDLINNLQNDLEDIKAIVEKWNKVKEYRRRNNKLHHERHREKVNEYNNNYIKNRYKNDPEFREKQKRANKERYEKQKMIKRIVEMQNAPALQDFGELNLIIK